MEHGYNKTSISLFEKMQRLGITPKIVTLVFHLKACGSIRATLADNEIHKDIVQKAVERGYFIGRNTLVHRCAKYGSLVKAHVVFNMLSI